MNDELPPGWKTTSLAELLTTLESGSRPRGGVRGIAEGVPSIGGEHLNYNGGFNFDSVKYVPKAFAALMTKGRIQCHDTLVVKDGATTGKTAFVDSHFPFDDAFVNEHVFICRPVKEIEPRFLFRFLMSRNGQERILENFKGSAQGGINQTFAPNTEVPLAPLAEQRRIVAKLEKLLGRVDACQQRLAKIPALLKRFRQAVLAAACSGRLTADWREENHSPETWRTAEFGEFIENSFYGPRFSKESYSTKGVPTIRTTDMGFDGSIVLKNAPCLALSRSKLEKFGLRDGDFLVTRTGATIGKCALYAHIIGPAIPGAYLIRFRLKSDLIAPEFVLRFFMSPAGQSLLVGGSTAVAQPNVNATTISKFEIPVPPLPEQQEIVRRVERLFALADQIEARLRAAQRQVDALTPSLLARAFAGKLVPQDPTDEPASVLLERIKPTKPE